MTVRLGAFALAVSALALTTPFAEAATHAIVVGVAGYPNLAPEKHLTGPRNDTREWARTLVGFGVDPAAITVLADGVEDLPEGVAAPVPATKAAILQALDAAVETSARGDLVFFYFSGHGSQQPDIDGDEGGGSDEIFLPYDTDRFADGTVQNALVDDELNVRVQKLLDKGVDVFGMIDACHSATGFRAAPDAESQARYIDPAELGVPAAAAPQAAPAPAQQEAAREGRGRAAFFYGAQENEQSLEMTPKGAQSDEVFGIFTYQVLKRLRETPALTYRRLHQAVVNDIKRSSMTQTQTPEIEGELLDEPVLRLTDARPVRQWPYFTNTVRGGQLDGLVPGTVLGLYDDPLAPDDAALAHVRVEAAGATRAAVVPVAWPCAEGESCAVDEAAVKKGRFARVAEPGLDFSLSLSQPARIDPADGHDYAPALSALQAALASPDLSKRVAVREGGYDVAVGLVDGKLAFSSAAGRVDPEGPGSSPRLTLPADPAAAAREVEDAVSRMARALALQRLAEATEGGASLGLEAELSVAKAKPEAIVGDTCSEDEAAYEAPAPAGDVAAFDECDIVSVTMANSGRKAIDVTALLVGADFSITPVWPQEGAANRIPLRESRNAAILQMEAAPKATVQERLVFIAVPGVNQAHTAFTNLEQEGLRSAAAALPGETSAALELLALGMTDMTRSTATKPAAVSEELSVEVRPFLVRRKGAD